MKKGAQGFTLIELLVVIGIIAILSGVVIIAISPNRQFAQARNTERASYVRAILDAISQRMADNQGVFETGCAAGPIPTTTKAISNTGFDIAPCLVPTYIPAVPYDLGDPNAHYVDVTDYDSGFTIKKDPITGRVTVMAPFAELGAYISATR